MLIGNRARLTLRFRDGVTKSKIDPSAVFFEVASPSGTVTYSYGANVEVERTGVGSYELQVDLEEAGNWTVRGYSTGSGKAAARLTFAVES